MIIFKIVAKKEVDQYQWHKWYAWRPVMTEQLECVWLETVERKRWYQRGEAGVVYRRLPEPMEPLRGSGSWGP